MKINEFISRYIAYFFSSTCILSFIVNFVNDFDQKNKFWNATLYVSLIYIVLYQIFVLRANHSVNKNL